MGAAHADIGRYSGTSYPGGTWQHVSVNHSLYPGHGGVAALAFVFHAKLQIPIRIDFPFQATIQMSKEHCQSEMLIGSQPLLIKPGQELKGDTRNIRRDIAQRFAVDLQKRKSESRFEICIAANTVSQ